MSRSTLLAPLVLVLPLAAPAQDPDAIVPGPTAEPPLRARVSVDGEELEVTLGRPGRTADGRPVLVELLPERQFRVEGAFELAYPRDWRFFGAAGVPTPVDAWWTIGGEGQMIHLRRHDRDARAVLREYVGNLESMDGSARAPVTLELDGRALEGFAVELDVGQVRGPSRRWVQEVFCWTEREGVSWLMSVQRDLTPIPPIDVSLITVELALGAEGGAAAVPAGPTSASLLTGFRWR